MKASYDNPERFGKLTLEITDRQEANVLWHILNMWSSDTLKEAWRHYSKKHCIPDYICLTVNELWTSLDHVYRPLDC